MEQMFYFCEYVRSLWLFWKSEIYEWIFPNSKIFPKISLNFP